MGIEVELYSDRGRLLSLPDPSGGLFDAAGDFDQLLPSEDPRFPLLGHLDPHNESELPSSLMPELLAEIDRLLPASNPGPQRRGLLRLCTLAEHCAEITDGRLRFLGD